MVHFHSSLSSTSQQQLGKLWGGEGWEWSNPEGQNVKLYRKIVAEKNYANIYHIFKVYKNCAELYKAGKQKSGVYSIDPDNTGTFDVYCDQKTDGGGWTVFQKRLDGSVDFYRGWEDYKRGFGNLNGEFWLGLDKIHRLTKERNRLHVDLEETTGKTAYAEYDFFGVASERSKYISTMPCKLLKHCHLSWGEELAFLLHIIHFKF